MKMAFSLSGGKIDQSYAGLFQRNCTPTRKKLESRYLYHQVMKFGVCVCEGGGVVETFHAVYHCPSLT